MGTKATTAENGVESTTERRAKWENFAMTVCKNGYVNVRNDSYGSDSGAHIYSVEVRKGGAVGCSCPHAIHRGAHCKHQVAVEQNPLVVTSATCASQSRMATDGGLPKITHHIEPAEVGGERYARCEGCESESIFGAHRILHDDGCPRKV